jgi:hypothetical protein
VRGLRDGWFEKEWGPSENASRGCPSGVAPEAGRQGLGRATVRRPLLEEQRRRRVPPPVVRGRQASLARAMVARVMRHTWGQNVWYAATRRWRWASVVRSVVGGVCTGCLRGWRCAWKATRLYPPSAIR